MLIGRSAMDATYRFYSETLSDMPKPKPLGWKNLVASLGFTEKDVAAVLDQSLLEEIESQGFLGRLGR